MTTALILLPIGGALAIWLLPMPRFWVGSLALLVALAEVGLWIDALVRFDFSQGLQLEQQTSWFTDLNVSYHVGFYGFSLWLVGLTAVVMACAIGYAFWAGRERPRAYFGLMLLLTGAIVGVFAAQDLLLFYAFWEGMLIPLYVLVGVWGGAGRMGATVKFVIYTMAGALLMLAAIIVFGLSQGTFDLVRSGTSGSVWIFLGFAAAFAVKAPLFPLHGWLPDAYRESSPRRRCTASYASRFRSFRGRRRTCGRRSWCWQRSDSCTARFSRSALPTSAVSSPTQAWRSWA